MIIIILIKNKRKTQLLYCKINVCNSVTKKKKNNKKRNNLFY